MCRKIILQDNESAMLLMKNGRRSYSKRTWYLNIRYFYVKDVAEKGKAKLAAANKKKRAATKKGKQHAKHGLHKGKKR